MGFCEVYSSMSGVNIGLTVCNYWLDWNNEWFVGDLMLQWENTQIRIINS